jgi:hypothetical protein
MFTNQYTKGYVAIEAHPRGGGEGVGVLQPPNPYKIAFKKNRFCRWDGIKSFTWFTRQPNQPLNSTDDKYIRIKK